MFTQYTYQDWMQEQEKTEMLKSIISAYKASEEFAMALQAKKYFSSDNVEISKKRLLEPTMFEEEGKTIVRDAEIIGNRIRSNFFRRLVLQQGQYLLGNGVTLDTPENKARLGAGFDTELSKIGINSMIQGVCWGYWNYDHMELVEAAKDALSGFVALLDERTSEPMLGVQFWQLNARRNQYIRLFETDGVATYMVDDSGNLLEVESKRDYIQTVQRDVMGERVVGGRNYHALPIVPLYGNAEKVSELTLSVKSKIDLYDRILSDFGDNLDKANDVYWVLNNYGGDMKQVTAMLTQIKRLKAIANISDGTGAGSTVEPHSFEVPYNARQTALELLSHEIVKDFMGLDTTSISGGSLTNVAIKAAMSDLDMKANQFEWQCFEFVQKVLKFAGVETEQINFKRRSLTNDAETIQNIYTMRSDIDQKTALKLNPYIMDEEIETIMDNVDAERVSGLPSMDELQQAVDDGQEGEDA